MRLGRSLRNQQADQQLPTSSVHAPSGLLQNWRPRRLDWMQAGGPRLNLRSKASYSGQVCLNGPASTSRAARSKSESSGTCSAVVSFFHLSFFCSCHSAHFFIFFATRTSVFALAHGCTLVHLCRSPFNSRVHAWKFGLGTLNDGLSVFVIRRTFRVCPTTAR